MIGVGGIGKTRLVSAFAESLPQTEEGRFISLARIRSAELVLPEIAKGFGIQSDQPMAALSTYLQDWHGVLILDNFEQVVAAAPDVMQMIPAGSRVTVLVTSQQPLGVEGEHIVRLQPLTLPAPDTDGATLAANPCVQLLVNRATAQDSNAILNDTDVRLIGDICRKLDGIPLAIELAAPHLISLGPEAVRIQLDQGQHFLSAQRRDRPERQYTMHSAIAWSAQLLPTAIQRVFRWMGVFAGGFDIPVLAAVIEHLGVTITPIDVITELVNFSLIRRVSGGTDPWFTMLATMHEFCLQELMNNDERDRAEEFLACYVKSIGVQSEAALTSSDTAVWSARLERELPTIRAAIQWSLSHHEPELPMIMADGLWRFMEQYGASNEVRDWIDNAERWPTRMSPRVRIAGLITRLALENEHQDLNQGKITADQIESLLAEHDLPDLRARFYVFMGHLAKDCNDYDEAITLYGSALNIARSLGLDRLASVAEGSIGTINYYRGDFAAAESSLLSVAAYMEEQRDLITLAGVYSNLAGIASNQQAYDRTLIYADKAVTISRDLDLKRELLYALLNLTEAQTVLGDSSQALTNLREAASLARSIDSPMLESVAYINFLQVYLQTGDNAAASRSALRALDLLQQTDASIQYVEIAIALAGPTVAQQHYADAAALLGKAEGYARELGLTLSEANQERVDRLNRTIAEEIGDAEYHRQRGEAWSMTRFIHNLGWYARKIAPVYSNSVDAVAPARNDDTATLTPREQEILQLLCQGLSTQAMADQLCVSRRTVTTHIGNITSKMQVSGRAELLAKVLGTPQR